jgi:hypothetical protein
MSVSVLQTILFLKHSRYVQGSIECQCPADYLNRHTQSICTYFFLSHISRFSFSDLPLSPQGKLSCCSCGSTETVPLSAAAAVPSRGTASLAEVGPYRHSQSPCHSAPAGIPSGHSQQYINIYLFI